MCVWFMVSLKSAMTCHLNVLKFQAWVIQPIKSKNKKGNGLKYAALAAFGITWQIMAHTG